MAMNAGAGEYTYNDHSTQPDPPHQPAFLDLMLARIEEYAPAARTLLDAGCGDGNFSESLSESLHCDIFGLDASAEGVQIAQKRNIGKFAQSSLYEPLGDPFGIKAFSVIVSVEVIEHLYDPRRFVQQARDALEPGGILIITTPYWGYLKNLLLAVTNRTDRSLTALWDGGHIKHWSRKTLTQLLVEQDFIPLAFDGSKGRRPPYLWNGFMMTFRSPG